jgi:hypothetical protein
MDRCSPECWASVHCGEAVSWHGPNSKVWSLGSTCTCGSGFPALSSKLSVPVKQQSQWACAFQNPQGSGACLYSGLGFQESYIATTACMGEQSWWVCAEHRAQSPFVCWEFSPQSAEEWNHTGTSGVGNQEYWPASHSSHS